MLEKLRDERERLKTERIQRDKTASKYASLGASLVGAVLVLMLVIMVEYVARQDISEIFAVLAQLAAPVAIGLLSLAHLASGRLASVEADLRAVRAEMLAYVRQESLRGDGQEASA